MASRTAGVCTPRRHSKPWPWRAVMIVAFVGFTLGQPAAARRPNPIIADSNIASPSRPEGGCSGHTCRMLCQYGFATDENGCPMCRCYDPCSEIQCPGSLTCQLEEQPCSRPPCLPVPTCKKGRSLEAACPMGSPLLMPGSGVRGGPERPFLCGVAPGQPGCPPPYACSVAPGNDYGVCCPSGPLPLRITKPGECPEPDLDLQDGVAVCASSSSCRGDLECPGDDKCCGGCCSQPTSVSECTRLRALAVMLSVSEREGRGYVPQCDPVTGAFLARQCSRNGRVCWCVDARGNKLPGSMGAGNQVHCLPHGDKSRARSLDAARQCPRIGRCANICQFGFKTDPDGCPTCECDNPCAGKICGPDQVCEARTEDGCEGTLCSATPVCIPVKVPDVTNSTTAAYDNVLSASTSQTDSDKQESTEKYSSEDDEEEDVENPSEGEMSTTDNTDEQVPTTELNDVTVTERSAKTTTPSSTTSATAVPLAASTTSRDEDTRERNQIDREDMDDIWRKEDVEEEERSLSMCEYLRDFGEKMEGTQDGMTLALPSPSCKSDGTFNDTQCNNGFCWCVDSFGTEIPDTRTKGRDPGCEALRSTLDCLDLTCRLACDFGFTLASDTRCPLCECRDPCAGIDCGAGKECQMVEVACGKNEYCPPVPACLPRKLGQCPYLIPLSSGSCEYQCRSDYNCNGTEKCCSNGCGTQCVQPMVMTECQHKRAILQHESHESGIPARHIFVPQCRQEDGAFEPVQCHPTTGQCWCVDSHGTEIAGTRSSPGVRPDCKAAKSCPPLQCSKTCPHGSQLDASGCPTCECRDPCAGIVCRGDGESCRLVDVECADPPCNPIPMCLPRRENPCPTGVPLKDNLGSWVRCGPNGSSCPSSHKCELSPLDEYAVCCPKPRDVCFEPTSEGVCPSSESRWRFNPEHNICEKVPDGQCGAQHNMFESREACDAVCPVLSQCERLREKNQRAAEKYKKWTFIPECSAETGRWMPRQCLPQVGVCWCVSPDGRPVEGSLTRDSPPPSCSSRQARRRMDHDEAPQILEDLIHQLMLWEAPPIENILKPEQRTHRTRCLALRDKTNPATFGLQCDETGGFAPMQCLTASRDSECWCVDEAGNQLAGTATFKRGQKLCIPTPVAAVEVTLGFQLNELTEKLAESAREKVTAGIKRALASLGGTSQSDVKVEKTPELLQASFELVGPGKVDRAFLLEEMVQSGSLSVPLVEDGTHHIVADMTKSRFSHRPADPRDNLIQPAERVVALEHREIVSESTVSATTPYHTAIVVLSVASSFVIVILALLAALYRRRMLAASHHKISRQDEVFTSDPPVFVVRLKKGKDAI